MKNVESVKVEGLLTGGIALTPITKGGNAGLYKTEDHMESEEIAYKKVCVLKCKPLLLYFFFKIWNLYLVGPGLAWLESGIRGEA